MLDQRARRRRSFGPAVALTLRCRNGTWKQPHDGGCARRPGPPRRRNTAAGPLPYPEFRRRRRESKRWPTNRAAALRLGTELGDLAVRLLPHSPQGPSPPPNAASSPASSASPAAHGRKSDTPGLRVVLHPSDAPQHVPTLFVWTRPTAPGPGTTVADPPGQEMDRIHVGLLVRPSFPLPVPTVHSGQRLMGPVVKREISQKNFAKTAERYCREAEERWTARVPGVVRRFRDDEATGKLEMIVPKPCPNGCLPPQK
jgi:hypothetical protein